MFILDPVISTILVGGGIFLVSFMLGRWSRDTQHEKVVEHTIDRLIEEGFLKAVLIDGEIHLEKLDGSSKSDEEEDSA